MFWAIVGVLLLVVLLYYAFWRAPDEQRESLRAGETDTDEESGVRTGEESGVRD